MRVLGVIVFVLTFAWLVSKCGDRSPPDPAELARKLERDRRYAAEFFAEQLVEKNLKAPSTADFGRQATTVDSSTNAFTVVGYVDAQNGFGAMIRSTYIAILRSTCDDVYKWYCWELHALTIGDKVLAAKPIPKSAARTSTPKEHRVLATGSEKERAYSEVSSDIDVAELQRLLKLKGFDPGPIDGKWGPKSTAALRAYRKSIGTLVYGPPHVTDLESLRK